MLTCLQQPLYNNKHLLPYYQTPPCLPVYRNHFTITNTSLPYYRTQLYLLAYSNHLTITSTCLPPPETRLYLLAYSANLQLNPPICHTTRDTNILICLQQPPYKKSTYLPYYQRYSCAFLPTATTLQKHPSVNHTTRDTTVLTCLQQPPYNNNHLSTILPDTQLYFPLYNNNHMSTIVPEIQLCFCAYSNHLTIKSTCQPYYQKHNFTYLPTAITLQ